MIHNKYYQIVKQFLGNYDREVYGRELVGKTGLSQKGIALALEELEKQSILKSQKRGTLRLYSLNKQFTGVKDVLVIAELVRKIKFMAKQRKLAYLFQSDDRIVGIFGSYAKGTEKADSDIDLFIIGKKHDDDYEQQSNSVGVEVSIKYFSEKEWERLLREKNSLSKEIISNHVLIFGAEQFVHSAWSDYYGFD